MEVANTGGVQKSKEKEWDGAHATGFGRSELILRGLALVLTLTAAILLGLDRQTKIIPVTIFPNLPAFNVPVIAKFRYVSTFVYFVVANSIASVFAAVSLIALTYGGGKCVSRLMIMVVDLIMVALLFSSVGATGAIGIIGFKGNSHLQWNKVCNVYGRFCHQVLASVALSLVGAILYFLLVVLTASKLQKRT